MGTHSSACDRAPRTAAVIGTEEEAATVAGTIARVFGAEAGGTAEARLDLLSRSGLFGISAPSEHGGIDVSNTVLADICTIASARSTTLAEILSAHFIAVEQVRSHGSESQQSTVFTAILAGARLARATTRRGADAGEALALVPTGLSWRLGGEVLATPCTRHADWVLLPVRHDGARAAGLLLPAAVEGLHYVANSCEPVGDRAQLAEHILLKDVVVDGDSILHAAGEIGTHGVPRSLELLLDAARQLGIGQRVMRPLLGAPDGNAAIIGLLSARLAATAAMIADAGRALDAAQIGLAEQHRTKAFIAAVAALAAAEDTRGGIRQATGGADGTAPTADAPSGALAVLLEECGRLHLQEHLHLADGDG